VAQEAARAGGPFRVVFVEGTEERIQRAARLLADAGIVSPTLLGEPGEVAAAAAAHGVGMDGLAVVDPASESVRAETVERYLAVSDLFSARLLTRKFARPLNFGAGFLATGQADMLAAGVTFSTGDVVVAAREYVGLEPGISTVSSVGFVDLPDVMGERRSIAFADCAVTTDPDATQLADIAITTADTVAALTGWTPRVALLSYSTCGSAEGPSVDRVVAAVRQAQERRPDLLIDGEFQLDPAILPAAAAAKVRRPSEVAGQANVLIFPDLDAGNMTVKAASFFGGATSYGPLLQGFARPVTDFSRSATADDVVGNVVLGVLRVRR